MQFRPIPQHPASDCGMINHAPRSSIRIPSAPGKFPNQSTRSSLGWGKINRRMGPDQIRIPKSGDPVPIRLGQISRHGKSAQPSCVAEPARSGPFRPRVLLAEVWRSARKETERRQPRRFVRLPLVAFPTQAATRFLGPMTWPPLGMRSYLGWARAAELKKRSATSRMGR
jgi:hypothetical protein